MCGRSLRRSTNTRKTVFSTTCGNAPGLVPRDRSIITLVALIARNQTIEMPHHMNLALNKRRRAVGNFRDHRASRVLLRLGECHVGGRGRERCVCSTLELGRSAPGVFTFSACAWTRHGRRNCERPVWRAVRRGISSGRAVHHRRPLPRPVASPGFAPRDRSLVTVSALIANGQVAQSPRLPQQGEWTAASRRQKAAEAITHLAFYVGWPNAFSALPVAQDVFEKRPR